VSVDAIEFLPDVLIREKPRAIPPDPPARHIRASVDDRQQHPRKTGRSLKVGICGELSSVEFCHKVGMDYVSCSPFRVPIARLVAAQAQLSHPRK
jgi:hypothetical protein